MTMESWIRKMVDFENAVGYAEIDCREAIQELGHSPASEKRDAQIDVVVASVNRVATDIVGFNEWIKAVAECIKKSDRCPVAEYSATGRHEENVSNEEKTPWDPVD